VQGDRLLVQVDWLLRIVWLFIGPQHVIHFGGVVFSRSATKRTVQRARPSGGLLQTMAISRCF
jgi:hypothetical protein